MSIYLGNDPQEVAAAVASVLDQTKPPAQVVIVQDGPVRPALAACVTGLESRYPSMITVVRLPENVGHGDALQAGLNCCRFELVARMDGDDLSVRDRFEHQLCFLETNADVAAVGGWVVEFESDPELAGKMRKTPCGRQHLKRYARHRNPMNHPTVMFRKSVILRCGGYATLPDYEDYHLWMRLLSQGVILDNLPEVLVKMRTGKSFYGRRGGLNYLRREWRILIQFHRMGAISFPQLVFNLCARSVRLLPRAARERIYNRMLRD